MADLPFHREFQATVVAFLWRAPGVLGKYMEKLAQGSFENAQDSTVIGYLYRHYKEHKKSPAKTTLLEYVRQSYPETDNPLHIKSIAALGEHLDLLAAHDISDRTFIEEQLKEFIQFEALKSFCLDTVDKLRRKEYDPNLPKLARQALDTGIEVDDLGMDWIGHTTGRIANAINPEHEPRIPTGIHHLDTLINGGLKAGELGILLGLPKGFKSGTMINFASSALKVANGQNHVAYVSLELDEDLVGLRMDFHTARMNRALLMENPEKFLEVLQTRQDILYGNNRLFIKFFKTKTATCDTLRAYLDRLQERAKTKIGMLVVDYLDLLKPTKKREKSYQEDVDICEDLRDIAQEYRMPVWTACRATRDAVGKRRISMAHMSRAFERVGVADLMIALCQTEKEKAEKIMRLYLAATRNSEGEKQVTCKIDYEKMLIKSEAITEVEYDDDNGGEGRKGGRKRQENGGEAANWDDVPRA